MCKLELELVSSPTYYSGGLGAIIHNVPVNEISHENIGSRPVPMFYTVL